MKKAYKLDKIKDTYLPHGACIRRYGITITISLDDEKTEHRARVLSHNAFLSLAHKHDIKIPAPLFKRLSTNLQNIIRNTKQAHTQGANIK